MNHHIEKESELNKINIIADKTEIQNNPKITESNIL